MEEIFCGKSDYFPGLLPLVYAYLDYINCDAQTYKRLSEYLNFIEKRATGELITPATWIRRFVSSHPDYKQDSVVPPSVAYDLLQTCQAIGEGRMQCPELLGDIVIERYVRLRTSPSSIAIHEFHPHRLPSWRFLLTLWWHNTDRLKRVGTGYERKMPMEQSWQASCRLSSAES